MFGCASFQGINPKEHMRALKYLQAKYLAPIEMRPYALADKKVSFRRVADDSSSTTNFKNFLGLIPPLVKGYIRLGAYVGEGAVIDYEFNTIDVCIVLPTKRVASRYMEHYDRK